MIIVLLEPASRPGDLVLFSAHAGTGRGFWRGSGAQPRGEVDVEIDVADSVDWESVEEVHDLQPSLLVRGDEMEIQGPVSGPDEGGVLSISLGDGSISLDTVGDPPVSEPRAVRVTLAAVEIYPTGT